MSFFNTPGKPNAIKSKTAPVIRKVVVTKKIPQPSLGALRATQGTPLSPSKAPRANSTVMRNDAPPPSPGRPRRPLKRGASTPDVTLTSDSDSDSKDDDNGAPQPRKKLRAGTLSPDLGRKRQIRDTKDYSQEDPELNAFVDSASLVVDEQAVKYLPAFDEVDQRLSRISLQYPGGSRKERFQLVVPRKDLEHDPVTDIVDSITRMLDFYLPPQQSEGLLDPSSGIPFLLTKARNHRDLPAFKKIVKEFNSIIYDAIENGMIAKVLDSHRSISFDLTERIMKQVYERIVSPEADSLRKYESFSDSTYGEILPCFAAQIFREARLTTSSVFLDLGSGVGSVVLQAALEYGCESWGIELENTPSTLAKAQAAELRARARLWGINVGEVSLLEGDFFAHPKLSKVISRADVILVNNQAFASDTNDRLVTLFLDVKEGARIVSLKSFVPQGFQLNTRTINDPRAAFSVKHQEYWTGCVSWKDEGGDYYVATKDPRHVVNFLKEGGQTAGGANERRRNGNGGRSSGFNQAGSVQAVSGAKER